MAVTDGKIKLIDADANEIEVSVPSWPYKTVLMFPFDIQKNEDGSYTSFDNGTAYDRRKCQCSFMLSAADMATLNDFLREDNIATTKGRAYDLTLQMDTDSGFFPFGPDKGDVGDFDVAFIIRKQKGIGDSPFLYFKVDVEILHTGSYPAYVLPSQVKDGNFTFGTVTENRFPPAYFEPDNKYQYDATSLQGGTVEWMDRSEEADWYETSFTMISNESKCAAIMAYITATARTNNFTTVAPANMYMFGRDKGNGTFTVQLIQENIIITHSEYNHFSYKLKLNYVSGPA